VMSLVLRRVLLLPSLVVLTAGVATSQETLPPADRFGNPLPPGAVARLGDARFRHGGGVRKVVYTPDGRTLVTLGNDGLIQLWDAATGHERRRLQGQGAAARALAVAPD